MRFKGVHGYKTGDRVFFGIESEVYFLVVTGDILDLIHEETWLAQAFFERWFWRGAAIAGAYWAFAWAWSAFW